MPNFRLSGLPAEPFERFFSMSDADLAAHGARRMRAAEPDAAPCRVSLVDADVGDQLILLPWTHQPADTPYRASGPVFVRRGARRARLAPGVVPPCVTRRLMSVRAYDAGHMMIEATVCEGRLAAVALARLFEDDAVAYIHLHNAGRGCFSCAAERA